ncbi:hypothetical protein L202_04035 [Cryptococcus amylolentus CBS 6039]|uniref:ABC1 atypical kinase-like domain-containing protein n=2 Tax=Cryptococcus amylolentus TaxID=104669 RepID=A0A1E3HRS8_9TREE|nr:hypothetical protein L202_04035 [Cryptococcus amylolentus CBS 6039]ODN78396.1 hypothetical protein L202_04035 [Cryptococcus amylolentus CBS 6039]ODO07011.1 hypothetical protein I350_04378 [Cryptococcus amylolentus CBS 6273]
MLTAAIRVIARSAAIQLEEAALASSRTPAALAKDLSDRHSERHGPSFPQTQTLSERLANTKKPSNKYTTVHNKVTPLDQLISNAPRTLPPAAPNTHPADKGHGMPSPLMIKTAGRGDFVKTKPKSESSPPSHTAKKGPSSIDAMIASATRTPPPPRAEVASETPAASQPKAEHVDQPLPSKSDVSNTPTPSSLPTSTTTSLKSEPESANTPPPRPIPPIVEQLESSPIPPPIQEALPEEEEASPVLRASKVPSSRIGRLFHYGSLAASLSWGAASESVRRTTGGGGTGSVFMSDANVRRLVSTLGRMRGAALKLGQFMSIQDNHMLPPEIEKVLQQVQAHANYMPDWQMDKVLREELGADWQNIFASFDRTPVASASIGQVHRATMPDGRDVAVKIQFPGVASSIESDLNNLSLLLRTSALLPPGLYLQNTIAVTRRELEDECDYIKEAAAGRRFSVLLKNDEFFQVPTIVEEGTTGKVLTTEWMNGKPLSKVKSLPQETRDLIGTNILRLCLRELFQFRFMQTDPNWGNFLYNPNPHPQIQLIDFGASREYTKEFMDGWYRLLKSALEGDRENMRVESLNLGYLTGEENDVMLNAHIDSMALVASPFAHDGPYPFAKQTITEAIRGLIPVMLKHRLTPPPSETYSLNRKLSGAFLLCAKMEANVDCKKLWEEEVGGYREG